MASGAASRCRLAANRVRLPAARRRPEPVQTKSAAPGAAAIEF
ncbi:MAG: hypothetical protein AVDCRST_MAG90-3248 [uncultured Microvirga sp.]|uniref:Uncharacterized protein n=1 Tax=uncultured Microvirga sp. TaxID=412392 RepID=A0A6J4MMA8_9HYPH|nr:MAG: hypothetical protein AVDCRST_MAG90-3248 [uncultured Microvirga sp.]